MILPILERELTWLFYFNRNMIKSFSRMRPFKGSKLSAVDMKGHWDETIMSASDVNAF